MTLARPIPATNDAAQQRLELELLLKQPVPDPEQLQESLPLLHALNDINPDRWRSLEALPIAVDEHQLDLAIPSQWGEAEWQDLIDQLPQNSRTIRLHPTLHDDLRRALTTEPSEQPTPPAPDEAPSDTPAVTTSQESQNKTESKVSLEDEASSFLEGFSADGVLETAEDEEAALAANAVDLESSLQDAEASPVVALVDRILLQAMSVGASDIHVEPQQKGLRLRYRQDGVLQQYVEPLPSRLIPAVTSRFKILADLDIAERRQAQDGRIRRRYRDRVVDFRVNTLPSRFGEKVCLRLLDSSATQLGLDKLISNPTTLELVRDLGAKPFGMILVTGPTGSGKSTTLYSLLAERNDPGINISTVEDPIEYTLPGITQCQVNREKGFDFAT
ncbi:MAG: GspE/PulE family protein, partial [Synechococcus sp.]